MKSIEANLSNEIIIKNSRFIAYLYKIDSNDITSILDEIKSLHPKATHYCYAYIYNDYKKYSDDGEPTGTAGAPILNVLEKEELNNMLVIVVRYFGGIKLGAGGLVRAYTKATTEALKKANYINLIEGYKVDITFNYTDEKQINYILLNSTIINKEYDKDIKYTVLIDNNTLEKLHNYNYKIIENILIEKTS